VQPPSVVIAANPYEAELCRRALVETGLRVVEAGDNVLELVESERPLVLVLALGLYGVDPLELLSQARARFPSLPIFLVGDREGEVRDEDAAAKLGATRLFLRPVDSDALADAIEKRAVEAELAEEVSEAMAEFSVRPPTIDAAPLVEESIVELEAEWEPEARGQQLAKIALRRLPRETTDLVAVERTRARAGEIETRTELPPKAEPIPPLEVTTPAPLPRQPTEILSAKTLEDAPPPSVALPDTGTRPRIFGDARAVEPVAPVEPETPPALDDSLLRADDAMPDVAGLGLKSLAPELSRREAAYEERSTLARRLERELSAAERRLFPDAPSRAAAPPSSSSMDDPYEDALGDIDLDKLGIDTIPGVGGDVFDVRPRNGHGAEAARAPAEPPASSSSTSSSSASTSSSSSSSEESRASNEAPPLPRAPAVLLPDDDGDLAATDIASLIGTLHAAGFSGRLDVTRGDAGKAVFFDGGVPVFAASGFAQDRLAELLWRDGKIGREQLARAREVPDGGRAAAQQLVELGLIKSSELFGTLRHHLEEIFYSLFAWETGRYRLTRELATPEDRVRLGAPLPSLIVEGVRRKYALERLVELVGPPETVLSPTVNLARLADDCGLTAAERTRAESFDGERSLAEIALGAGAPLGEANLYALAWSLVAVGAARVGDDGAGPASAGLPTLVTPPSAGSEAIDRRGRPRPDARPRDREADRTVEKERVLAKRAQVEEGDYFAVLGLARDATPHEIARAFERLKREFAPERFAESVRGELRDALAEIGEVLDEARRVLGDERVRDAYRAALPHFE
jgi:hypothetical protein